MKLRRVIFGVEYHIFVLSSFGRIELVAARSCITNLLLVHYTAKDPLALLRKTKRNGLFESGVGRDHFGHHLSSSIIILPAIDCCPRSACVSLHHLEGADRLQHLHAHVYQRKQANAIASLPMMTSLLRQEIGSTYFEVRVSVRRSLPQLLRYMYIICCRRIMHI